MAEYIFQAYPKWVYSATEAPRIVNSVEEEGELGDGWGDSPAAFDESTESDAPKKRGRPKKAE